MTTAEVPEAVAAVVAAWNPRVSAEAAAFARTVVGAAEPVSAVRARCLLWACSRLGAWGISVGLEVAAEVMLHHSVIERYVIVGMPQASEPARRTVRANLRFVARRVGVAPAPLPRSLRRNRAKAPYSQAEIAAYFALAGAQPTPERRDQSVGLLCLGLGAGLEGAELRGVCGGDVRAVAGGVVVDVAGPRARVVPVTAAYASELLAAAGAAGDGFVCGGFSPTRKNVTTAAMGPDGLVAFCDAVVEASVPEDHKVATTAVAVDWTDLESWARATGADAVAADPDASWGHRSVNSPGTKGDLFFGYYAQAVTMVAEESGQRVAELVRRICMHAPATDPVPAMAALLGRMVASGVLVGDVLADSGYAHRIAEHWADLLRRLGLRLVQDLHPHDRGPKGTFGGAITANGNLWCPAIPSPLLAIGPLARGATDAEVAAHDARFAEALHYKLGPISATDADGYHRVACPAAAGKLRCPLKAASMLLDFDHPEVLSPPSHPPRCCTQDSITVSPDVNAKTRQKHDYPGPAFRRSYRRRTAVERSFSTFKDSATTNVGRGWCRLMGRAKNLLMLTMATVVRNLRVLAAFETRQRDDLRRAGKAQPARTRRRRRQPSPSTAT